MIKRFAHTLFRRAPLGSFRFSNDQSKQEIKEPAQEAKKEKRANQYNEDAQQDEDAEKQYQKEDRSTTGWMIYRIFFWGSTAILGYNLYLVSHHDKKTPVEDQRGAVPGFITVAKKINKSYNDMTEFMTKPPVDKLLPDIVHPLMHPKTLVLNVTGTLLETEYVFGKGLVVHKRPGLNQFLKKMSQIYEVVLFSDEDSMLLQTLIQNLDPRQQIVTGYFGHECMVLSHGHYIKDLKYLNRDLRNVIMIDKSKEIVEKQPENVIVLSEYHGDENDRELIHLSSLLENLNKPNVRDVRKALAEIGENPVKKYEQMMKLKQEKIKSNKGNRLFDFFSKKEK